MKIRWWLAAVMTAIALVAVAPTSPAAAARVRPNALGSPVNILNLLGIISTGEYPVEVVFNATDASGRSLCLDAANGAPTNTGPQADVWGCGANANLLTWQINAANSTDFYLRNVNTSTSPATTGCLDDWNAQTGDGSKVAVFGPRNTASCPGNESWSLYFASDGNHMYLAPAGGWTQQVASPAGTNPGDGALVHMWHYGANNDQYVFILRLS